MKPATTWKLLLGVFVVLLLGGLVFLARDRTEPLSPDLAAEPGEGGSTALRSAGRASLPASLDEESEGPGGATETTGGKAIASAGEGAGVSAGGEETTVGESELSAEEAETRARERYEAAQRNAFQFRKTDPSKVVPTAVMPALTEAAQKYKIPQEILVALMAVESGGAHRDADHSMEGGFGVMNLKENNLIDTLGEAAALLGKEKEEILYDQKLNIEAAALLLSRYYEDSLAAGLSEPEAWYMALSQYSGRPNPELAAALADEVAGTMMRGFETELNDGGGKVTLPPDPSPPFYPKNWKLAGVTPPPAASGTAAPGDGAEAANGMQAGNGVAAGDGMMPTDGVPTANANGTPAPTAQP